MKKLTNIDAKLLPIPDEENPKFKEDAPNMSSLRDILRMIGNVKAASADDARRTRRLIVKLKDKTTSDIVFENEDLAFLQRVMELNNIGLTAWAQGQILDYLDSAETYNPPVKKA